MSMEIMMILQTTQNTDMKLNDKIDCPSAFTLLELMIVLAIISAMMTIVLPYAASNTDHLQMKQHCLNIVELARYGINLAAATSRPSRLVINPVKRTYCLQTACDKTGRDFEKSPGYIGNVHSFSDKLAVTDITGFEVQGKSYCLTFDTQLPWPNANIALSSNKTTKTIKIRGKQVECKQK